MDFYLYNLFHFVSCCRFKWLNFSVSYGQPADSGRKHETDAAGSNQDWSTGRFGEEAVNVQYDHDRGRPRHHQLSASGGDQYFKRSPLLPYGRIHERGDEGGRRTGVRVALKNAGISSPSARITVSLAPADIPKRGIVIDLPVAVGELICMELLRQEDFENVLVAGELGLNGEIRPVRGILPIVQCAKQQGIRLCILPKENETEGAVVEGIRVVGVRSINELIMYMCTAPDRRDRVIPPAKVDVHALYAGRAREAGADFRDVRGQSFAKKAMEIAAAGFLQHADDGASGNREIHSRPILCMPGILPPMSFEESMEVSAVYSVAGAFPQGAPVVLDRPFPGAPPFDHRRRPGRGRDHPHARPDPPSPTGESCLWMSCPEFGSELLDLLRQPLEEHSVTIVRQSGSYSYPSLLFSWVPRNPCPCGYYPDRNRCRCTSSQIRRYLSRISGPLLDRMDLYLTVPRARIDDLQSEGKQEESSAQVRSRVMEACERQKHRFRDSGILFNADMRPPDLEKFCPLGSREKGCLRELFETSGMSVRAYHRIIRVARTIADLEGQENIRENHLYLAYSFRRPEDLKGG